MKKTLLFQHSTVGKHQTRYLFNLLSPAGARLSSLSVGKNEDNNSDLVAIWEMKRK
jgi:hypothetical protein